MASDFNMAELVQRTAGCSGSDLKELCRNAAMIPIREYVRSIPATHEGDASQDLIDIDISVCDLYKNYHYDMYSFLTTCSVFFFFFFTENQDSTSYCQ